MKLRFAVQNCSFIGIKLDEIVSEVIKNYKGITFPNNMLYYYLGKDVYDRMNEWMNDTYIELELLESTENNIY